MSASELTERAAGVMGGKSVEALARDQIVKLMTVAQYVTDICLNEIERRGELTFAPGPEMHPIVRYCSELWVPTILTRRG
jgi:hypothetical protein